LGHTPLPAFNVQQHLSLFLSLSLSLFLLVMKVKMVMPIRSKKARNAQIAAVAFLLMGFFSVC
jgi:hypothetical protein